MGQGSRRNFWANFWGKSPEWSPLLNPGSESESAITEASWIVASRQAMGTFFELRMVSHTLGAVGLAQQAFDLIDDLEMQMTIYRDDSTIAHLNAHSHERPIVLEQRLYDLLKLARSIHYATDGAYDITTGALSRAWGFVKAPKRVPTAIELAEALSRTGLRQMIFDDEAHSLFSTVTGLEINLGSIGKGYAIDRVVELFRKHPWPTPAMIHGGRSSLFALGHQPGTLFEPWTIALHNPLNSDKPLLEIKLVNQAVGTSGGTFQSFEAEGRSYGHIIDPRTGIPPLGPLSVTVIAPTAAEADALSTAFYLTGPVGAARLVQRNPQLSVVFLRAASASDMPEILAINMTPDRLKVGEIQATWVDAGLPIPEQWSDH